MNALKKLHKYASLLLALFLIMSTAIVPVSAEEDTNIYVFHRDGNGQPLYQYQSPCMLGYDMNNQYGDPGVPRQAFVYTMYNTQSGKHFSTYCTDINVTAVQGAYYRRMNLEYSPFAGKAAGVILKYFSSSGFSLIFLKNKSLFSSNLRIIAPA